MTTPATDDANAPARAITQDDLPVVGDEHWWRITHNPRAVKEPIIIELMELHPGSKRLSQTIGRATTIAHHTNIIETADLIVKRTRYYALYLGEYGRPEA